MYIAFVLHQPKVIYRRFVPVNRDLLKPKMRRVGYGHDCVSVVVVSKFISSASLFSAHLSALHPQGGPNSASGVWQPCKFRQKNAKRVYRGSRENIDRGRGVMQEVFASPVLKVCDGPVSLIGVFMAPESQVHSILEEEWF